MDQLLLSGFSRLRVQPRNLLPAGMEITPYNHHCEDSFLPSVFGPQIKTTGSNRVFALIQSTHSRSLRMSGRLIPPAQPFVHPVRVRTRVRAHHFLAATACNAVCCFSSQHELFCTVLRS